MKRFLYILIPLLFFINSAFSGHNATTGLLSPIDWWEKTSNISGEITEVFSDDLIISRKIGKQDKAQRFFSASSDCFYDNLSIFNIQSEKVAYEYPFSSSCRQAVCYGLLFLQQLF